MSFDWAPERGYYLTHDVYVAFVGLMMTLQVRKSDVMTIVIPLLKPVFSSFFVFGWLWSYESCGKFYGAILRRIHEVTMKGMQVTLVAHYSD